MTAAADATSPHALVLAYPAKGPFHTHQRRSRACPRIRHLDHKYGTCLLVHPESQAIPHAPSQGGDTPKTGRGLSPRPHEEAGKGEEVMGGEEATTLHFICGLAEPLSPPLSPLLH